MPDKPEKYLIIIKYFLKILKIFSIINFSELNRKIIRTIIISKYPQTLDLKTAK